MCWGNHYHYNPLRSYYFDLIRTKLPLMIKQLYDQLIFFNPFVVFM